jgi:hypothetical protein
MRMRSVDEAQLARLPVLAGSALAAAAYACKEPDIDNIGGAHRTAGRPK